MSPSDPPAKCYRAWQAEHGKGCSVVVAVARQNWATQTCDKCLSVQDVPLSLCLQHETLPGSCCTLDRPHTVPATHNLLLPVTHKKAGVILALTSAPHLL